MLLQCRNEGCNGTGLLTDSYINTIHGLTSLVETLLIDNGINGDGSLTCLTVANDQLTLSTTDRNHRVDGLQSSLQRLLNGLAVDNTRGLTIQRHLECLGEIDITLTVDSLTQRIDNATEHVVVYTDRSDTLGTLHYHAFLDA